MRFSKYMEYSIQNNDLNEFRSCKIQFSKSDDNIKKIENIMREHALDMSIIKKIEKENKKLNLFKNGNFLIDFIIDEKSNVSNNKIKNKLKLKVLEFNDDLCKIQRKLEEDLKKMEEL